MSINAAAHDPSVRFADTSPSPEAMGRNHDGSLELSPPVTFSSCSSVRCRTAAAGWLEKKARASSTVK